MVATLTVNDLVTQFAGVLESKDATRLTELKRAASLVAAEKVAMQTEGKRLAAKYGANSKQAEEAAALVAALEQQQASLAADVIRAGTPTPAVEAANFVVYGRVFDAQGKGVSGAKVLATDVNDGSLASTTTTSQGVFELSVPLQSRKKSAKTESVDAAAQTSVSFQLLVSAKNLDRPYTSSETLTGLPGLLAYREIRLPDSSEGRAARRK